MTELTTKQQMRREQILEAAKRIFQRDGLVKASMRVIAKEAGVTTGAIYPLFEGKQDLYATLLDESLERLYNTIIESSDAYNTPLDALIAAIEAFYTYYAHNPFDANIGVYMYGMGQVKGMGAEWDARLNKKLLRSLDIFATHLQALAPAHLNQPTAIDWAKSERDVIFALLLGVLTLENTGRAKSIDTQASAVLSTYVNTLRKRLDPYQD